jgi:hypothetical protein
MRDQTGYALTALIIVILGWSFGGLTMFQGLVILVGADIKMAINGIKS